MRSRVIVTATAGLCLLGLASPGAATAGGPRVGTFHVGTTRAGGSQAVAFGETTAAPCFRQLKDDSGVGVVSQWFHETTYRSYNDRGADDFTLSSACVVTSVDAVGVFFNGPGPAHAERVVFYSDDDGTPGAIMAAETVQGKDVTGTGSFHLPLTTPFTLDPGTYWVSVRIKMAFSRGGEWGWETTNDLTGNAAVWQNAGGGLGVGCHTFANMQSCVGESGEGPDYMFSINAS